MNTADYVDKRIEELLAMVRDSGMSLSEAVFTGAKLCVGWPYVYGAWGAYCTPAERKKRQGYHPEKTEITNKCQVLNGSKSSCDGCKWFPDGCRVRCFDCRGFTDKLLNQFNVINLYGDSVGVQWKTDSNWKAKGTIDTIPDDVLVCLFVQKDGKWQHTGFGYKGHTCECSAGVQYFEKRNKKWSHWAVPKGIDGDVPTPTPTPVTKPTLRRGSKGDYVKMLQVELVNRGYNIGNFGVDGDYGRGTEAAVKEFQRDNGLNPDGICGPLTWSALEATPITPKYTVTIPHLNKAKAEELVSQYIGATMTEEG